MTPDELAAAGRILYGERWQTSLSMDLDVTDRTMRRWLASDWPIPDGVKGELQEILVKRLKKIGEMVGYVVNPSDRSVLHFPTKAFFRYDKVGSVTLVHRGLADRYNIALVTEGAKEAVRQERERVKPFYPAFLKRVDDLVFSVRTDNCLKFEGIVYIGDLVQKTEDEMLRLPNFGRRSLNEIKEVLAQMELNLGMDVPGWPPENIDELAKRFEGH